MKGTLREKLPPPKVLGVLFALIILSIGAVVGAGVGWYSPGTSQSVYDAPDGPIITETADFVANSSVPVRYGVVDYGLVRFEGTNGSEATMTSISSDEIVLSNIDTAGGTLEVYPAGNKRVDISGSVTGITLRNVDVTSTSNEIEVSGSGSVDIHGLESNTGYVVEHSTRSDQIYQTDSNGVLTVPVQDGDAFSIRDNEDPQLSNANPSGGDTLGENFELNIDVADNDFSAGDSVEVTFYDEDDDSVIGTDNVSSNGTATTVIDSLVAGEQSWYAVAEDSFGNSVTSSQFVYNVPDELRIYYESKPSTLISDDVTLRVRFFVDGESRVIERETNNGIVSLQGLPPDERFIVTVRANQSDKFTYRRVVVDSLIETQEVYLLNRSKPNSQIIFTLDDPTGQFPPESTTLYVEKPISKDHDNDGSNETRYQVIAGDTFGATSEFPAVLETDARYRLRVESDISDNSRILGAYSVSGPTRVPIQIERISPEGTDGSEPSVYGGVEGNQLAVRYLDTSDSTENVEYRVLSDGGEVIVANTTRSSTQFADVYALPSGNGSYTVEYTITKTDGETISGSFNAGRIVDGVTERLDADPSFLELLSYVLIIASMGLVVLVSPALAPMTGTGVATLLTVLGTVAIPAPILGIAGAISVLLPIGRR